MGMWSQILEWVVAGTIVLYLWIAASRRAELVSISLRIRDALERLTALVEQRADYTLLVEEEEDDDSSDQ